MERVTRQQIDQRLENLNRRMEQHDSRFRYFVQGRNGYYGLDRWTRNDRGVLDMHSTVIVGTKRDVSDWLHAAMVAIDDCDTKEGGNDA